MSFRFDLMDGSAVIVPTAIDRRTVRVSKYTRLNAESFEWVKDLETEIDSEDLEETGIKVKCVG